VVKSSHLGNCSLKHQSCCGRRSSHLESSHDAHITWLRGGRLWCQSDFQAVLIIRRICRKLRTSRCGLCLRRWGLSLCQVKYGGFGGGSSRLCGCSAGSWTEKVKNVRYCTLRLGCASTIGRGGVAGGCWTKEVLEKVFVGSSCASSIRWRSR
jgi:hypothetical protein